MLGYYNLSLIGTSHLKKEGGLCQDANSIKQLENGWIVASIADGLGSSLHSEIGSDIAVHTVVDVVSQGCPAVWDVPSLSSLLETAYDTALTNISKRAEEDGNPMRDYETTLTSVIYNGSDIVYAHVGDGGVLTLNHRGEFKRLTEAQKGEAFNQVVPLRAGSDAWVFGSSAEPVCALLMMTDGIYDVACPPIIANTTQPIRINYVRQFMDRNILCTRERKSIETIEDFAEITQRLKQFYEGAGTKSISDDKTIVGIINTDILPEIQDASYYKEPDLQAIIDEQRRRLYECAETESKIPRKTIRKRLRGRKLISKRV